MLAAIPLYLASARRVIRRTGTRDLRVRLMRREERLVFVVGSPRSGTTFLARAIGSAPGFIDLTEVTPLKAAIPELAAMPVPQAASQIRRILERVRLLSLARGARGVEQTPETAFVLAAALRAYPEARAVHVVRDGRDVVCSLLERGWLNANRDGGDDARATYGSDARFWVDPTRAVEFSQASDARRAAWAWRTYVSTARSVSDRVLEVRYASLVADPRATAEAVAAHLGAPAEPFISAFSEVHDRSIGRFAVDLTPEQLAEVESEAGPLLEELGFLLASTSIRDS